MGRLDLKCMQTNEQCIIWKTYSLILTNNVSKVCKWLKKKKSFWKVVMLRQNPLLVLVWTVWSTVWSQFIHTLMQINERNWHKHPHSPIRFFFPIPNGSWTKWWEKAGQTNISVLIEQQHRSTSQTDCVTFTKKTCKR